MTLTSRASRARCRPSLDLSAFRIVQEALTNVRKHAAGAPASVRVVWRASARAARARHGHRPRRRASTAAGHGLVGMRERVKLHGGELHTGALPGGGFEVARGASAVTSVLLADDQELVRAGFRLILELDGFDVVGEAGDGAEALELARELEPDVVLMDVRMPRMDGIEATRRIGLAGLRTRVLVLTTFDMDEHVYDALRAGASGFLLKDAGRERLIEGVRTVAAGESLFAPDACCAGSSTTTSRAPPASAARTGLDELSERELEVLGLIGRGLSNTRDRRGARDLARHRQDPRPPRAGQARPARPRAGGRARLRVRAGVPGR